MNNKRYKEFRDEIDKMQKRMDAAEFFKTLDVKLLDYAMRNPDVPMYELEAYVTEIFAPRFKEYAESISGKYNEIVKTVNDLYSDLGVDMSRDFLRVKSIEAVNKSYLGKFSEKELEYITKKTREGLFNNLSKNELAAKISKVSDTVSGYADVIAQTQIKGYAQNLKNEKARIGEVDYFRYADLTIRPNSHLFCIDQVAVAASGVSIHINEILKMSNGTELPVITYKGGWHCYHDWEPDPFYGMED
jgi:hypothetical protein